MVATAPVGRSGLRLVNGRWEPSLGPADGIVARYTNDGGTFRPQDTVLLSELLTAPPS